MAPKQEQEIFRSQPKINILLFNNLVTTQRENFASHGIDITHLDDFELVELLQIINEEARNVQTHLL